MVKSLKTPQWEEALSSAELWRVVVSCDQLGWKGNTEQWSDRDRQSTRAVGVQEWKNLEVVQPPLGPIAQLNIFSNSFTGLFCFWESLSFACTRSLIRSSFPGLFAHAWEMMSWTWLHCVVGSYCQSAAASCSQRKYCTAVKRKKGKKNLLGRVLAPACDCLKCSMVRGWRRARRTGWCRTCWSQTTRHHWRQRETEFRIQFLQCGTKNVLCGYVTVQYNYTLWHRLLQGTQGKMHCPPQTSSG